MDSLLPAEGYILTKPIKLQLKAFNVIFFTNCTFFGLSELFRTCSKEDLLIGFCSGQVISFNPYNLVSILMLVIGRQ